MDDLPLIIKFWEVVAMEVLVGAAVVALLIAAVRDIVESRVQELRRQDQIAVEPEGTAIPVSQPTLEQPAVAQPARPVPVVRKI